MTATDNELVSAIARIEFLREEDPTLATRLGGLTNRNYLIPTDQGGVVVRLAGEGTSEYIDRHLEEVAARSAANAGVNAEVLFFDPSDGLMATRLVPNARTMTGELFAGDLEAVKRAADAFRRLHTRADRFATDFKLFEMIDEYKTLLASKQAALPDGYELVQSAAESAQRALETSQGLLVPSHCDPLCENFLDTGDSMYLIDYEYAGNNDPMWDLADVSVEGAFTPEMDEILLRAYFQGDVPAASRSRMIVLKAMVDLLWTLWGVIQHVNENPADDFWSYACTRFERCKTLLSSPDFQHHITQISPQ